MRALSITLLAVVLFAGCGQLALPLHPAKSVNAFSLPPAPARGTTYYVDGVHGSDKNDCRSSDSACKTIRHAVALSETGDTIKIAAAMYRENVVVHHSLHFAGAGQATTIVDGQRHGSEFLIAFSPHVDVVIAGMTLRDGSGSGDGGAIYHCEGSLTLDDVLIEGNRVRGASLNGYGGAIYNCPSSTLTITDSTIRNNSGKVGGAICNGGVLTIFRSTFSGNESLDTRGGGAIFNYGTLHIADSTLYANRAAGGLGGAIDDGQLVGLTGGAQLDNDTISDNLALTDGGGIYNKTGLPIYVENTIIADNVPENCAGTRIQTEGFNLIGDRSCELHGAGDMNGVNARLGPLQNNGGPTETAGLLPDSPAIDAGNQSGCRDWVGQLLVTDQRGMPRPDKGEPRGCDIGAFESQ